MIIVKAIETLELLLSEKDFPLDDSYQLAIKLGIEALKYYFKNPRIIYKEVFIPLPSETDE